jgi:hypothetical protein
MKKVPPLIPFLIFVSAFFIGILVWAYVETKKANPQMIEVGLMVAPCRSVLLSTHSARIVGQSWLQ